MTSSFPLSVYRSPLSVRYLFTVIRYSWFVANGQCMVNGKWLTANGAPGGSV